MCCCGFKFTKLLRCDKLFSKCRRRSKRDPIEPKSKKSVEQKVTPEKEKPQVNRPVNKERNQATTRIMSVETSRPPNLSNPKLNGGSNGVSPSYRMSSSMTLPAKSNRRISSMNASQTSTRGHSTSHAHGAGASYKLSFVSETASTLKRRSYAELGAGVSKSIIETSFIDFIGVIRSERLSSLPHKGSRWDKVLIKAQYFAELLNNYDTAIQGYALDSKAAAAVGYGHARLLIELGHEHSQAMEKVFSFFYKLSLQISALVARADLLAVTPEIREELCLMFTDLLSLVTEVSIRLYKRVKVVTSRTSLDLYEVFGETIQTINVRCAKVTQEIWSFQIENEGFEPEEVVQIDVLKRWLGVQDHVLASLSRDHTTFADHQAEFTGLWFQKHLSRFIQGQSDVFLVNGEPGSGKTVLAASIADRLQRPVARKSFSTVFCSISSGIPTQASSINVVKSLLFQLLDIRVGNVTTYEAVANAYRHSRNSENASAYEDYLWTALAEALRHPIESANDLVLVVDGLDELSGGSAAAQKLFERLVEVTHHGKNVKLISLSESIRAPSNADVTQLDITPDDIGDDVREVVLKALRDYRFFNTRDAGEQDSILERITLVAKGSFVWAILACDVLELEKDAAAFDKTLAQFESSRPSNQELTLRLLTALNLNDEAKTILGFLLAGQRPFTTSELRTLYSVDVQKVALDKRANIPEVLRSLRQLVYVHEDIVRIRHRTIHHSIKAAIDQGKFTVPAPVKDGQTDLLLRTLAYSKLSLGEKYEPTLDDFDQSLLNRLFNRNVLLEYSVRYWTFHLKQSPICPKQPNTKFHVTPDLQRVFPDNVILPILEWLCWEAEISTHQALDLHLLISSLRGQILPETSLSILQTYIIISTYYTTFNQTTDAIKYYYLSTKICSSTLSDVHPLTIDISLRFFKITETLKFTKRTEIVKYKEEVLQLIIRSYTKQYGSTSEQVIKYETALAELYVSIQEEERAREIFLRLRKLTIDHYGEHSEEARGVSDHLTIVLRKDIVTEDINQYEESIFLDQDEQEEVESFTLEQIDILLRRAELYVSKKEWYKAEQTYIELWQQVSSRSRTTRAIEWHRKNIEVTHEYSKFLHSQKRETETAAVLICLWQEYEHHELVRSEQLVEQLTEVARFLKTVNQHTVALSILKYASSYYTSVRKQESKIFTEIEEEIAVTSTEVVKQSLSKTTTTTETTNTVSRSTFQSVFHSMISNKTKTVDKTTIELAKKLTTTYIEEQKYTEAISIVHSTFARIWSSFLHESIQTVTLTTSFLEESIELVEQLAESYLKLRQFEKVEDVYLRLFQAVLTSKSPSEPLFGKSRTILVSFYDKYGFPDKAIKVIQEVLVVSKKVLGPSHKLTIEILYDLGSRCRNHARNHPYWPDYYQQIIVILNKDSDVCHQDAMNALIIVGTYYWEDRRYAEAVQMYSVLWSTFVKKTKEYKHFSETKFVMETYERYFQCLEETRVELDVLHKVASEYRETSIKTFGSKATITTEATISLARVSQRSEKYSSQAISLYEELTTSSSSVSTTKITQIKEELLTLYTREIKSKKSTSVKTESIERAISIYSEQLVEQSSKYGYSEISTLTVMRELLRFYARQEKKEQIIKEIHTAVVSIVNKETQSQKLIESASYLAETISILHLEEHTKLLIEELHSQIIAKHRHSTKMFSFDLTKTSRTSLVFIAGLEYYTRTDLQITFSEIMSGLLSEAFYYDNFYRLIQANDALDKILIAAAPLRTFLLRRGLKIMAEHVENETIDLFRKRDTAKLALRSQNSPRYFIVVILEHLGRRKSSNFINSVIVASNENVLNLTKKQLFNDAYDVANCAFLFAKAHDGYNAPRAISQGFKLALLLAGRGGAASCPDQELRKVLLQLSNRVIRDILEICKRKEINFAKVQLTELNQLVALLGDQEDWVNLEWLLSALWTTREAQRTWPGHVLLKLGRNLIMARYLANQLVKAIRLAEDISYNLRRVHGLRHPATLETYQLLTQLYTSAGKQYNAGSGKSDKSLAQQYFRKAFLLHEELLKMLVYEGTNEDEDDDELDSTAAILSQHGVSVNGSVAGGSDDGYNQELELSQTFDQDQFLQENLRLMKLAYQRLGAFPKRTEEYTRLIKDLFARFGKGLGNVEGVEKWSAKSYGGGKAESEDGAFVKPAKWEFADSLATEQVA